MYLMHHCSEFMYRTIHIYIHIMSGEDLNLFEKVTKVMRSMKYFLERTPDKTGTVWSCLGDLLFKLKSSPAQDPTYIHHCRV